MNKISKVIVLLAITTLVNTIGAMRSPERERTAQRSPSGSFLRPSAQQRRRRPIIHRPVEPRRPITRTTMQEEQEVGTSRMGMGMPATTEGTREFMIDGVHVRRGAKLDTSLNKCKFVCPSDSVFIAGSEEKTHVTSAGTKEESTPYRVYSLRCNVAGESTQSHIIPNVFAHAFDIDDNSWKDNDRLIGTYQQRDNPDKIVAFFYAKPCRPLRR